jgi:hypothetical protein
MDANNFSVTLWDKDAEQNGPLYLSQAVFERAPPVVRSDA